MRKSREEAAATRERIVDAASVLFRERGIDGISLSDLMREIGLTHGGFYRHFDSKAALVSEACERALAANIRQMWKVPSRSTDERLEGIVERYLSDAHGKDIGHGCTIAALGGEAARQGDAVRRAFADGISEMIESIEPFMPGSSAQERYGHAAATLATLVGALVIARSTGDRKLARVIAHAAKSRALAATRRGRSSRARRG